MIHYIKDSKQFSWVSNIGTTKLPNKIRLEAQPSRFNAAQSFKNLPLKENIARRKELLGFNRNESIKLQSLNAKKYK